MPVPLDAQYEEIGYFARSHGVHGELLLMSDYPLDELAEQQPLVRYRDDRGDLLPARLVEVRRSDGQQNAFFVKLMHIDDLHGAEQLKGKKVWVDREVVEGLEPTGAPILYHQFRVFDEDENDVGIVVNGFDTGAQQILEVELDEDEQHVLVPAVDEFIVEVNEEDGYLVCRNLDMLKEV